MKTGSEVDIMAVKVVAVDTKTNTKLYSLENNTLSIGPAPFFDQNGHDITDRVRFDISVIKWEPKNA